MANRIAPYRSTDIVTHVRDWFMTVVDNDKQYYVGTMEDLYRAYYAAQDCSNLSYCLNYHEFVKVCDYAHVVDANGVCAAW